MARRLALITGASAGIGAASARIYASHGYDVALTARRADRLEGLAAEIKLRSGVEAYAIPADLAEPTGVDTVLAAVAEQGRVVDALVNNAGYGLPGTYDSTTWADQAAFLQLMLTGVCEMTHKVLPGMVERKFGRIVNVASLAGLVPGAAGHTLYAATKGFLVKFSQSLHLENLATGVHVSALCPGFTYSEFHDVNGTRGQVSQGVPEWMWLGADEVAAAGYEAAEANRSICVPGAPNKAIAAIAKIVPDDWALALMASQGSRFRKV
ncbi:SDR family oxidoreductase [Caulobacter sp. 602-1]|uniref:SDR family NAD(P)-dependent oxidoreductase n=1 Tax=unclassified Caulobacter TaxID=2648921 RepID=UPI000F63145F|nr:SDR family oxidoreductase [Caulobacter sp. 602-1]RRN64766.1 SDR family oxidoreductase [Caulobacter sp. 602-1]